jgi:hypothetical protein
MNTERILNWFEIPVGVIQRAKTFYETIFEMEMNLLDLGEQFKMAIFPGKNTVVGGALVWNPAFYKPSSTHGSLIHLNANPDLQMVQDRIEAAGGKLTILKRGIGPGHGFMAVFIDTEGNRVALHSDH